MTNIPFDKRQYIYEKWNVAPPRWPRNYDLLISPLKLLVHHPFKARRIVELGCSDGSLAVKALGELPSNVKWTGYDISRTAIKHSKKHPQYIPVALTKQLWNLHLPRFDVFISSHTVEHLYPEEVIILANWLSEYASHILLLLPTPEKKYGRHVLGKSGEWITEQFEKAGFHTVLTLTGWFGWFTKA